MGGKDPEAGTGRYVSNHLDAQQEPLLDGGSSPSWPAEQRALPKLSELLQVFTCFENTG